MPIQPVKGHEALKEFIAGFISPWTSTEWEIVSLIASGDHVVVERVDKTSAGDKQVDLPCVGVFEMELGKIKVWRDYFDMNTYIKGMS
jgi:limonene-1,2-epoxide hydrolase